ncbi:DNA alkylation repair protein [Candidatus Nesciobacter abundans]|uniref:DNA alkylation repair protein n=1 Tax=Candidatus Nesciobacter abundans TaxID=2601668 RepID=A0A5C0UGR5_9PROT|nr:DNA alkylation repair protein [Candidatus Nesciobacter abundans]QEK39315.1 DNA alkylation repair protein [Candidatus Nesciobacter abundans]
MGSGNKLNIVDIIDEKINKAEKNMTIINFFKVEARPYAKYDEFLGVQVPILRKIVKEHHKEVSFNEVKHFIMSEFNEKRLIALLFLVSLYKTDPEKVVDFYLENIKQVNNWNLVDLSCYKILGDYLLNKDKKILFDLSKSENMWERRISIISTLNFIKNGHIETTLKIGSTLVDDDHDLIHRALGWMLREVGKINEEALIEFLSSNDVHNTTFNYSVEKLTDAQKKELRANRKKSNRKASRA